MLTGLNKCFFFPWGPNQIQHIQLDAALQRPFGSPFMWSWVTDMSKYQAFYIKTTSLNINILLEFTKSHQVRFLNNGFRESLYDDRTGMLVIPDCAASCLRLRSRSSFPGQEERLMKWLIIFCTCEKKFSPLIVKMRKQGTRLQKTSRPLWSVSWSLQQDLTK